MMSMINKWINTLYLVYYRIKCRMNGVIFTKTSTISSDDVFEGKNYIAAWVKNCYIGMGTSILKYSRFQNCKIGKNSYISSEVKLVARRGHPTVNFVSTSPIFHLKTSCVETYVEENIYNPYDNTIDEKMRYDVIIGDNVYIGTGTIIIGSITIGDNAIIEAGSIVTKDVPPYAVLEGNPARIVGYVLLKD